MEFTRPVTKNDLVFEDGFSVPAGTPFSPYGVTKNAIKFAWDRKPDQPDYLVKFDGDTEKYRAVHLSDLDYSQFKI